MQRRIENYAACTSPVSLSITLLIDGCWSMVQFTSIATCVCAMWRLHHGNTFCETSSLQMRPRMRQDIVKYIYITMSSYNGQFQEKLFTQIEGATIGGPESASVTDIFGAVYIDEVARQGDGSLKPNDWCRYRDDTWDIEEVCDDHMVKNFTNYLNETILKDKIKFEPVTKETGF